MNVATTILLYGLLASLAVLGAMFASTPRWGPEGPVGAAIVFVPSLVLAGAFLLLGSLSGRFDWFLPNRVLVLVGAAGTVVALGTAMFSLLDRGAVRWLGMMAMVVVGVACYLAAHAGSGDPKGTRRIVTLVLFGVTSLGGYAVLVGMQADRIGRRRISDGQDQRAAEESSQRRLQEDADRFAALPVDAPFFAVSQFVMSTNDSVRSQARARLKERPDLEAQLIDCLAQDGCDEVVAFYLSRVEDHPPAGLAPAYAAFLDRQLASWKSSRLLGPNPSQWKGNLSTYFDAAERIQASGGDLRPSLRAWRDTLEPISGFDETVRRLDRML